MSRNFFMITLVFLLIFMTAPFRAECNKADVITDITTAKPVVQTAQSSGALLFRCAKVLWKGGYFFGPPIVVVLAGFYAKKHRDQRQVALLVAFLMGAVTSYFWIGWPMVSVSSGGWWIFEGDPVNEFSFLRLIGTGVVGLGGAGVAAYISDRLPIEKVDDDAIETMADLAKEFVEPYLDDEA